MNGDNVFVLSSEKLNHFAVVFYVEICFKTRNKDKKLKGAKESSFQE